MAKEPVESQAEESSELPAAVRSSWAPYIRAKLGFRNYWYPVTWSSRVGDRPVQAQLLGERIVLCRDDGRVYALRDRCPHRGVPLHLGRKRFPGTLTCPYHG